MSETRSVIEDRRFWTAHRRANRQSDHVAKYWTPNATIACPRCAGLGAKSIVAIVLPEAGAALSDPALIRRRLTPREKSLELIRMYNELAQLDDATEETYALELENRVITFGLCYEERPRFTGRGLSSGAQTGGGISQAADAQGDRLAP